MNASEKEWKKKIKNKSNNTNTQISIQIERQKRGVRCRSRIFVNVEKFRRKKSQQQYFNTRYSNGQSNEWKQIHVTRMQNDKVSLFLNISHLVWCKFSVWLFASQSKSDWKCQFVIVATISDSLYFDMSGEINAYVGFAVRSSQLAMMLLIPFGTHENVGNLFISSYYIMCFAIRYIFKSTFIIQSNALIDSFRTLKDLRVPTSNMMNMKILFAFSSLLFILRFAKIILCNRYRETDFW